MLEKNSNRVHILTRSLLWQMKLCEVLALPNQKALKNEGLSSCLSSISDLSERKGKEFLKHCLVHGQGPVTEDRLPRETHTNIFNISFI
jgi:hypothetical protein